MKISRIEIDGFRCFGEKRDLSLKNGSSLCLLAENGRGKTSIADALEFWACGDVGWTHRDGVGLSALIHLDCDKATVEVKVDGVGISSRSLSGKKASSLTPSSGPLSVDFEPEGLPVLRHRTMTGFVEKSANDKRTELLEALGLSGLSEFRRGVRSTAQKTKRLDREAAQQVLQAQRELNEELEGESLSEVLRRLSHEAALGDELTNEDELLSWEPSSSSPVRSTAQSELDPVSTLTELHSVLGSGVPQAWEQAVADRSGAEQRGLSTLLNVGRDLIANSDEDQCPLCLLEQDRENLLEAVALRAKNLAAVDEKFEVAESQLHDHQRVVGRLLRAAETCLKEDRPSAPQHKTTLESWQSELHAYSERLSSARRSHTALGEPPPPLKAEALEALRKEVLSAPTEIGPALLRLAKLKGRVSALAQAKVQALDLAGRLEAAEAAAQIADNHVEKAVQQALDQINHPLAAYYSALVGKPVYTDLRLTYTEGRAGGIEFVFKWDRRKDVKPPQRVMSESELNALGLALFLARIKTDPPSWRTMVLDDVVTSFDDVHHARLIRLLATEFSDWQIILLTHDQVLSRTVDAEAPEWRAEKVVAWQPREGPSFASASTRARLKEKLDRGEPAAELGALARQTMEEALERPVRKLRLKIRHDPQNVYSADEYRRALVEGLNAGNFPKADAPVLERLKSGNSITNRACHYKDQMPGVTEGDLRLLLDDLEELDGLFHCESCGKKAWAILQHGSTRCQCECGILSCA